MQPTSAQLDWAIRFAQKLLALGTRASPEHLTEMGEELWATQGHLVPEDVAAAEFKEWPPHDD